MRLRLEFFDSYDAIKEVASSVQLQVKAKSIDLTVSSAGCQMLHADHLRFN